MPIVPNVSTIYFWLNSKVYKRNNWEFILQWMVTVTRHAHKIVCCIIQTHVMKSYSHYRGYISIQTRLHEPQFPHIHSTWHLISLRKRLKCNGFGLLRSGRHDQESSLRMFLTESSCHSALGNRTHCRRCPISPRRVFHCTHSESQVLWRYP